MSRFDTDIVERLRWDKRYTNGHVPLTLEDAAKEIERLRAALQQIAENPYSDPSGNSELAIRALGQQTP